MVYFINRTLFIFLFVFVIACGDRSPAGGDGLSTTALTKDRVLNREGLKYYRNSNFQVALERFRAAAALNSKEAEYPNNMGMCYLRLGKLAPAEKHFARALSLKKLPLYHHNRGLTLMRMKKGAAAQASFQAALKLEPKYVDAWVESGRIYYGNKDHAQARKAWEKAKALRDDAPIRTNLGMLELREGKLERAEREFRKAVALNASYGLAHYNLGVVLQKKKDYSGAEKSYARVIALNPRSYVAHYNLAVAQASQGKKREATVSLEQFLRLVPPNLAGPIADAKKRLRELKK